MHHKVPDQADLMHHKVPGHVDLQPDASHAREIFLEVLAIDSYRKFNSIQFFKHVRIPW
jgi:hypothetical protein